MGIMSHGGMEELDSLYYPSKTALTKEYNKLCSMALHTPDLYDGFYVAEIVLKVSNHMAVIDSPRIMIQNLDNPFANNPWVEFKRGA